MKKGSLSRNVLSNVLQMALGALMSLLLYRYLAHSMGVDKLGVWSVVLATASASRLAGLGFGASVTRFVAKYLASAEPRQAAAVIETGTVTLSVVLAILLPAIHPLLAKLLVHLFEGEYVSDALVLLPYAMFSLWLSITAAVFQSGLDGCQRMDRRAGLMLVGQLLMLVLVYCLVPAFSLVGLAWAQVGRGIFLLLFGWLLLRRCLPHLSRLPLRWRSTAFREMLGYGVNVQIASVFMMLLDPLTKALMVKFGGATAAGYFEIANQLVVRLRGVVINANRAIVPRIAHLNEVLPERLPTIYRENLRLLALITLPCHTLAFAWAGIASLLVLGGRHAEFVFFLQLATVAWGVNVFAAPAYLSNLGTGRVGWNTLAHSLMGGLSGTLGFILGGRFGAAGVAWAYAISLVVGSWLLIAVFHRLHGVSWRALAPREYTGIVAVCIAVLAFPSLNTRMGIADENLRLALVLLLPPSMMAAAVWFHPLRKHLWMRLVRVPPAGSAK